MAVSELPRRSARTRSPGNGFRADIEGLRAVAVGLVLLYHARVPGFGGGYVGVDVFFVVSGFLITGLILRELRATGTLSLPAFYARRARRLLPAAALALAATVVASALFLPPLRVPDVAGDGLAAALYASNIRFALQATDYLAAELDPSPLLHFWSLGVEEQFYLFWPALLLLACRGRLNPVRRIALVVALVGAGSLALAIVLTETAAPWAFFSLPTRAWELALGAAVMLAATRLGRLPAAAAATAGAVGLGLIGLSAVVLETSTPFPGTAALLPTVGAALVIAAGARTPLPAPSRLLAVAPLRFVGRISYSLYLWHWPIIVIPAAMLEGQLPLPGRIALALAAVPVAAASQRWVEDPIRRGRFVGLRPRRTLATAGALSLAVATMSGSVGLVAGPRVDSPATRVAAGPDLGSELDLVPLAAVGEGTPDDPALREPARSTPSGPPRQPDEPAPVTRSGPVPSDLVPSLGAARDDLPPIYADGCHVVIAASQSDACVYGAVDSSTTVALFGDSHAAQWFPMVEQLARERGWRMLSLTKAACPAADATVWNGVLKRTYTECDDWRARALERLAAEHPALVVVSNSRGHVLAIDGARVRSEDRPDLWAEALGRTLRQLTAAAGATVLIGDTPRAHNDPPVCLSAHTGDILACASPHAGATDPDRLAAERAVAAASGVTFVDPTPLVCPSDPCPVVLGRLLIYRDEHHLTATFARSLTRYLVPAFPIVRG